MSLTSWMEATAAEVMTTPVTVVDQSDTLESAVQILAEEGISGVPVVTGQGRVVGVLTLSDVVARLAGLERELGSLGTFYTRSALRWDPSSESYSNLEDEDDVLRRLSVSDVMTAEVLSVTPEASMREVARIMYERRIHRVLVLGEGQRLVGLISSLDVLGALLR